MKTTTEVIQETLEILSTEYIFLNKSNLEMEAKLTQQRDRVSAILKEREALESALKILEKK